MLYVFEHKEIRHCYDGCPLFDADLIDCKGGADKVDINKRPDDCPLMVTGIASKIKPKAVK